MFLKRMTSVDECNGPFDNSSKFDEMSEVIAFLIGRVKKYLFNKILIEC